MPDAVSMESDPMVCVDASSAFVFTDRCIVVSQRRAAACVACALFLGCMSTTALLHWSRQMQEIGEAKPDLELFSDSKLLPPWTTIRWMKHPTKCLDIAGEGGGAQLQIWSCSDEFPKKQRFIAPPPGTAGQIKWATHPELCLDNSKWNELQLWHCSRCSPEKSRFKISPDGKGRIVLADQPNKCMDIPTGFVRNGLKVQLWDCSDATSRGREDNIKWITKTGIDKTGIDCKWGTWSSWSACPVTCGGGRHIRSRKVEVNATGGGRACRSRDDMEMGSCGSGLCEELQQDNVQSTVTSTALDPSYNFITTTVTSTALDLSYNFIATTVTSTTLDISYDFATTTVTSTTLDLSYRYMTTTEGYVGNGRSGTGRGRLNIGFALGKFPSGIGFTLREVES